MLFAVAITERIPMLRGGEGAGRVTTVELFFDLVYVFAITQLSHVLLAGNGAAPVFETAILLALTWQIWIYTTWATTYVDPRRLPVRAMLLVLMLGSLVLAVALPDAFGHHGNDRGLLLAITYVVMQIGRSAFLVVVLEGALRATFVRAASYSAVAGVLMIVGGLSHGHTREVLWIAAVLVELVGAAIGFRLPGYGAADTHDWTIHGGHFAERVQAFVLIALGESIVVTGGVFTELDDPSTAQLFAFLLAFVGSVAFWWVYFDRAADDSAERIENSDDPGRIARSAFHWVHPLIIGGIVVSAAADETVLLHPDGEGDLKTGFLILGSTALFLAGHAIFKALVWRVASWPRIVVAAVLLAIVPLSPHASPMVLGLCSLAGLVVVGVCDRLLLRSTAPTLTD